MSFIPRLIQRLILAFVMHLLTTEAVAAGIYSQLVVSFNSERPFSQSYSKSEHSLTLEFQKTAPNELAAFEQYDERLIRRVLITDLGPAGTAVKLILRDRNVRAIVNKFQEPFRVSIDLYDADYEEERDPNTGMPLVGGAQKQGDSPETAGSMKFVAPLGDAGSSPIPADAPQGAQAAGKMKLLHPTPELFANPDEMASAMRNTPDGIGKAWREFPPYVYRIQTAAYEEGMKATAAKLPNVAQALNSAQAMADYAGKLFNLGHEAKALVAYQQVLHLDPTLFDKDALHLWKFAETQLGTGNLTLARGYYEAINEKHPESPLAHFARLRSLDVAAIRLLTQDKAADLGQLLPSLDQVRPRHNGELTALVAIRRAYWGPGGVQSKADAARLPKLEPAARADLGAAYPAVESSRTAFLAASLLMNDMVAPSEAWQRAAGPFAEAYFKRFSGAAAEPYRQNLKDALHAKLNANLQAKVTEGKLIEAIDDYETLPATLKSIKKTPKTAWALAEAYRKLSQQDKAIDLYQAAAKTDDDGPDRFKAEFWLAHTAGERAAELKKGGNQETQARLAKLSREADKASEATWKRMKPDEQEQVAVAYKEPFEKAVTGNAKLRTAPKIVLSNWTKALATKTSTGGGDATDMNRNFSPSGAAVILLSDLGKRFAELGMPEERRQAIGLLKSMKPSEFEDDKAAKQLWANQLMSLAEDYRKGSQFLDAGRIYSLIGAESENWEGRAEALYKGGLLLYRAGRREEALEAFKKAGEDGNNLFYANLAKERLAQLQ